MSKLYEKKSYVIVLVWGVALILILFPYCLRYGVINSTWQKIIVTLVEGPCDSQISSVLFNVRIPRILAATIAGISSGVAVILFQKTMPKHVGNTWVRKGDLMYVSTSFAWEWIFYLCIGRRLGISALEYWIWGWGTTHRELVGVMCLLGILLLVRTSKRYGIITIAVLLTAISVVTVGPFGWICIPISYMMRSVLGNRRKDILLPTVIYSVLFTILSDVIARVLMLQGISLGMVMLFLCLFFSLSWFAVEKIIRRQMGIL